MNAFFDISFIRLIQCSFYYYTESIRDAIEEADYDQDAAIEALSSSNSSSSSTESSFLNNDKMCIDDIKEKCVVKVVIEVIALILFAI